MAEGDAGLPETPLSTGRLILWILLLVLVGVPMVYVLWDALNLVLQGEVGSVRWALVLPVLAVFVGFVLFLARLVGRWEERRS